MQKGTGYGSRNTPHIDGRVDIEIAMRPLVGPIAWRRAHEKNLEQFVSSLEHLYDGLEHLCDGRNSFLGMRDLEMLGHGWGNEVILNFSGHSHFPFGKHAG